MTILAPKIKYEHTPWGEIISGSKHELQRLGIATGMAFPGEAGAPKRCLKTLDPRGFPVRIIKSYLGEDYSACIDLPGRERYEEAPKKAVAPGVAMREHYHFNAYTGTADALVAAGVVLPGQFPGQPGMRKATVTIFADGTLPSGAPTARHRRADEPGAKRVQRASKTTYQVSVNVPEDEAERRRETYFAARDQYEARLQAIPRPAPLSIGGIVGRPDVGRTQGNGNVVDLQAARMARERALTARQIEQRVPPLNAKARMVDTTGEERRCLWVSQAEAEFLSHMYQYGMEAAAMRLMLMAGKPWPEPAPKRRKAKAVPGQPVATVS